MTFVGVETIGSYTTDHLRLIPLREPNLYPLRDLWIDRDSSQVVRLTYQQPFNAISALIQYDFAPQGKPPTWVIMHISAYAGHDSVSQDLKDISFPSAVPEGNFGPGAP